MQGRLLLTLDHRGWLLTLFPTSPPPWVPESLHTLRLGLQVRGTADLPRRQAQEEIPAWERGASSAFASGRAVCIVSNLLSFGYSGIALFGFHNQRIILFITIDFKYVLIPDE